VDASPIQVLRIDHVVFRVSDLAAAVGFYTRVLGMTVERERPDLGLIHLRAGDSQLDLISIEGPLGRKGGGAPARTARNADHVCLRVNSFDEARIRAHLASFGLPLPEPAESRFGAEGYGLSIYLQDPDGNTIELKGPLISP
jgi:catechol 2,3-dioxygenase-like lactoylglutathione lyase family enzyme